MTLLLTFASGTSKSMWAVRSSGLFLFCFPFFCSFHLPLPPGRLRGFFWDLPSFENLIHPLTPSLGGREGREGTGHSGRPGQELRERAGRREAVDISECLGFGFVLFF